MLTDDKASHLSHVILKAAKQSAHLRFKDEETAVLRTIKRVLAAELADEIETDRVVRQRLASYARPPIEGSPEWDVLYRKFLDEELRKRKKG
jgi:hypothetical protein